MSDSLGRTVAEGTPTEPHADLPRHALVVKLGGRALEAPGALSEFAAALRAAATPGRGTLVVHGGGALVSTWCARVGLMPRFSEGLRVTDPDTLDVAAAVLAGLANKRLVASLRAHGLDAVGLSLLDGGIAHVQRHTRAGTLGEVGQIASVKPSLLLQLLAHARVPVLASLGDDGQGGLLNLNADDAAAAIAGALVARDLVLLSDAPGLVLDGEVVRSLDAPALERALGHPQVTGGMVPKLRAAQAALAAGVQRVHIAAWQGPGTLAALLAGRAVGSTLFTSANARPEESHV